MGIQILILDDEKIVGERLKASLEKDGHSIEIFTNPIEALENIERKKFNLVITDIRMAEMDGIQILETIKEKSFDTKVIMITGYATLEVARESLTKGAFDFISKPFKLKEIRDAIHKVEVALQNN
jgi:DNA-binding NtrC family response regulator